MKTITISGTQGSGKTTLIRDLIAESYRRGLTSGVIVNEAGETEYDDAFISDHQSMMEMLRGG